MISITLICGFLFTFAFSAASAHGKMAARCSTRQPARAELHCGNRNLWHANHLLKFLGQHPRAGRGDASGGHRSRRALLTRGGRWLRKYALRHIATARARLRPPVASLGHVAGWLCIHSREGAWNSNTGNGYYGGLQAHLDWYGVHRMDWLSPWQQMAAAERAYRQSGYSRAWLAGQWPNTYPPCAGLF